MADPSPPGIFNRRTTAACGSRDGLSPRGIGTFDFSVKNPNGGETIPHRSPQEIMEESPHWTAESAKVIETIRTLL